MEFNKFEDLWKRIKWVDPESQCWIFDRVNTSSGYGEFMVHRKRYLAHRLAYELLKESIPNGLQIDHLCRNRACINPDHLEPVTRIENLMRGMSFSGKNARKTHCHKGHKFSPQNTIFRNKKKTHRSCRKCCSQHSKAWKARNPDYWKNYKHSKPSLRL